MTAEHLRDFAAMSGVELPGHRRGHDARCVPGPAAVERSLLAAGEGVVRSAVRHSCERQPVPVWGLSDRLDAGRVGRLGCGALSFTGTITACVHPRSTWGQQGPAADTRRGRALMAIQDADRWGPCPVTGGAQRTNEEVPDSGLYGQRPCRRCVRRRWRHHGPGDCGPGRVRRPGRVHARRVVRGRQRPRRHRDADQVVRPLDRRRRQPRQGAYGARLRDRPPVRRGRHPDPGLPGREHDHQGRQGPRDRRHRRHHPGRHPPEGRGRGHQGVRLRPPDPRVAERRLLRRVRQLRRRRCAGRLDRRQPRPQQRRRPVQHRAVRGLAGRQQRRLLLQRRDVDRCSRSSTAASSS